MSRSVIAPPPPASRAKGGADAYPDFAASAAGHRLDEAQATGADVIATACGGCRSHLAAAARADGRAIRVAGIFERLASASGREAA